MFSLAAAAFLAAEGASWYVAGAVLFATGTVDALVQGATWQEALKAGAIAGATGAAFTAIGGAGLDFIGGNELITQTLAFGTVGGITEVLRGGQFGHGFVSAGVSAAVGGSKWFKAAGSGTRFVARVIVGGTASEISGGQFANGAATAAFSAATAEVVSTSKNKPIPAPGEEEAIREFAQREKEINSLLADPSQENLEKAVQLTAELYDIDLSKTTGGFHYRSDLGNSAAIASHSCMCVRVSDTAMTNVHQFGATLVHEVEIHINQHFFGRSRRSLPIQHSRQWYLNEVDAFNHEIRNQWRFGYSDGYKDGLIYLRDVMQERANNAKFLD